MPLNISTIASRITASSEQKYQRALRYVGIADCTEMRVTSAVAVCVVIYYIICFGVWVAQTITDTDTITALVQ